MRRSVLLSLAVLLLGASFGPYRGGRRIPPGPQIVSAEPTNYLTARDDALTVRDYLEYALASAGWAYRIEAGKVTVYDPAAGTGTADDASAPADR